MEIEVPRLVHIAIGPLLATLPKGPWRHLNANEARALAR